jgi:RND family efflux transporter MFP subunit
MNRMKSLSIFSLLGIILLGLPACSEDKPIVEQQLPKAKVSLSEARYSELPESYRFTGTVESDHRINLSTKLMGIITELDVEEGDRIQKGQVLVRIKSDNLEAQKNQVEANITEAQAALKNTETNLKRIKALFEEGSATQKELDDIQTQYDVAQSRLRALKSKMREIQDMLDYADLEAPTDGFVVRKFAETGDMAAPGQPLVTIESLDDMQVRATVPESQIDLFTTGTPVQVQISAVGHASFSGSVISVNPGGSPMSRQYTVKISLQNVDQTQVKSGMFARVLLTKGDSRTLMIPRSAIVSRGQLTGIYTLSSQDELMLRWIRTGRTYEDQVEVLSGLQVGERYVSNYEGRVREGQPIAIQ